jgi:ArsR family transcriptional regulator
MGEPQPKISKHLGKLRDMGFVKDERQEQFIYYGLNIKDELFIKIIQGIVENVDDYEIIKNDLDRSNDTQVFLEACKR